ncbi:MAG: histidine phosphatase family protein [Candidatus Levybacteria bacterium]|nr:histidine phosphatase family protein [Candidatus Levybacteria bacterium]
MPNTEIYLIRHGLPEYEYDSEGFKLAYGPEANLSEEGRKQAHAIAHKLPKLDVMHSSPFARARQTSEIIASHIGFNAEDIVESKIFADQQPINFEGKLLNDVIAGNIELDPDDETDEQVYERVNRGFEDILKNHAGKKVGIVFHGHPIRYIVWKHVEKKEPFKSIPEDFIHANYALQGEAWVLILNEEHDLIDSHLITRDDNQNPGRGVW